MIKIGIVGITGFTGFELFKVLALHKGVEITYLASRSAAGKRLKEIFPQLNSTAQIEEIDIERINGLDAVFLALPHTVSMEVAKAVKNHVRIIDLSADFRLKDPAVYERFYKKPHTATELLKTAVYGLPEINKEKISKARIVANPGCYATSAILGIAAFLPYIETDSIIVDSKSGVSGAGRGVKEHLQFCEVNENFYAYSIARHRHTPEIESTLSELSGKPVNITFSPHLLPIQRGILSTIYATLTQNLSLEKLYDRLNQFYSKAPFVRIKRHLPQIKEVSRTNYCDIGIELDIRNNRIIIVSVLDNLVKGASGQAVQNFNIMFGFNEEEGLGIPAGYP